MTLREFRCVECGNHFFVYVDEYPQKPWELILDLSSPCCRDMSAFLQDWNLTITEQPKLDCVKPL
jgi:hypothetical protein